MRMCVAQTQRPVGERNDAPKTKTRVTCVNAGFVLLNSDGAGKRNRTPDLRITNALLYRLSYSGIRETRL